jgi:hypothetical protein
MSFERCTFRYGLSKSVSLCFRATNVLIFTQDIAVVFQLYIHKETRKYTKLQSKHNFICVQTSYMFPQYSL